MTNAASISFPAIKVNQPIGQFFIGAMKASDLVSVSSADVRRLNENEIDTYIGIQRRLSSQRSKELKEYVNSFDATFPTAVIIAVDEENATFDEKTGHLVFRGSENKPLEQIANIIDGQHRVDGLSAFKGDNFDVSVSVFVGADIATQANIFATVNLAQTKVNRSLAYDLLGYEKLRSPQKAAHHIAVALDRIEYSPFYRRIKRLGSATPGRVNETVTQAAIVESILDLTSKDPMSDRNSSFWRRKITEPSENDKIKFPFRQLFLEDEDDDITQILLNYFTAVREKWPNSWDALDRKGNVLPKTNGIKALMRFLKLIYPELRDQSGNRVPEKSAFRSYLEKVDLQDDDFNTDTFKPGTSGEATLYKRLKSSIERPEEQSLI